MWIDSYCILIADCAVRILIKCRHCLASNFRFFSQRMLDRLLLTGPLTDKITSGLLVTRQNLFSNKKEKTISCTQEKCIGNGWPQISYLNIGKTLQPRKSWGSPEGNLQNKNRGHTSLAITIIIVFIKIVKQVYTHKAHQYPTTRRASEIADTF